MTDKAKRGPKPAPILERLSGALAEVAPASSDHRVLALTDSIARQLTSLQLISPLPHHAQDDSPLPPCRGAGEICNSFKIRRAPVQDHATGCMTLRGFSLRKEKPSLFDWRAATVKDRSHCRMAAETFLRFASARRALPMGPQENYRLNFLPAMPEPTPNQHSPALDLCISRQSCKERRIRPATFCWRVLPFLPMQFVAP